MIELRAGLDKKEESTENQYITREETKQILTPFAFNIDKSLFGIALAAPWRRGFALAIDLFLIALLSDTPGEILAIVIALTFYRLGDNKRAEKMGKTRGRNKRGFMRFIGALIIFFILADALPGLIEGITNEEKTLITNNENEKSVGKVVEPTLKESFVFTTLVVASIAKISQSDCDDLSCWETELSPLMEGFAPLNLPDNEAQDGLHEIIKETQLSTAEQKILFKNLFEIYQHNKDKPELINTDVHEDTVPNVQKITAATQKEIPKEKSDEERTAIYSVMKWTEGIINDLGLGFGWAAFYFTVFTALWKGQTPGKKLLGIKVLQLDGTPLSLWDSFGRYGGYGAGIATGLLGFIQIYWDPNRQAIHDKISATIVIDIKKAEKDKH